MKSSMIVVAAVAAVLAFARVTPSLAAKNAGAFNQGSEANNQHPASYCKLAKNMFKQYSDAMDKAPQGPKEAQRGALQCKRDPGQRLGRGLFRGGVTQKVRGAFFR
ncbi:MAG: hypothetical protein ABIQ30_11065 [Devosia sp.]